MRFWHEAPFGWPDVILCSYEAFGDTLLLTAVARALVRQSGARVAIATVRHDLFRNNPDICGILKCSQTEYFALLGRLKKLKFVHYSVQTGIPGLLQSPKEHIISVMCRETGVMGKVELLPRIYLGRREMERHKSRKEFVVVQSSIANAGFPIINKEWYPDRMQQVVDQIRSHFEVVQVGLHADPALNGVTDMRGKLGVREVASLMFSAKAFIGMVGFLMHLARAVDCPSVIVYGGREAPWQTGYTCNENIYTPVSCAPCWREDICPFERHCMEVIDPKTVVTRLDAVIQRSRPLSVDTAVIV